MNADKGKKIIINFSFSIFFVTTFILLKATSVRAFNIHFDYKYDESANGGNNFFSGTEGAIRKNTLEQAGQYYETYINDNLSAIVEDTSSLTGIGYELSDGSKNTATAFFKNPATGIQTSIVNPTFLENQITVYAGARDIDSLGIGGFGGYNQISGTSSFVNLVKGRGQTGALTNPVTDIGLWGGSIAFDNNITVGSKTYNWHNESDITGLESNEYDFLSVAIHEIGHVLGISTADSWKNQVSGTDFTGINSITAYNQANNPDVSAIPLYTDESHWQDGTEGLTLQGIKQEAALDPIITSGQRKMLTNLDYAGLADVGWDVDPDAIDVNVPFEFSPSLGIVLSCSIFGWLSIKNKLKKAASE